MKFKVRQISGVKVRKRKKSTPKKSENHFKKILKYAGITLLTIFLMLMVYFAEQTGMWFKASILEAPQPFNGTAMPIAKVPNWEYWSTQQSLNYNQVDPKYLIDLPKYDLDQLQFPTDQLKWGDSTQDEIRNAKIAYSVVYMGNYKLDHIEDHGSHAAVDIKIPVGTPIHAIANGKVTKTSLQSSGFGHHIVIKHVNVPDPDNPNKLTTLYSSYSHMSDLNVVEGQNVLKGEVIGLSGNTGTSTTPHLHFQIDRDSAPWYPYFPFTWQEAQEAGLSFFEAINAGLGKQNAHEYTIHPIDFVLKNLNYTALASSNTNSTPSNENNNNETVEETVSNEEQTNEETIEIVISEPETVVEKEPEVKEGSGTELFSYTINGEPISLVNNGVTLTVIDESNQLDSIGDNTLIKAEIKGVGSLLKSNFTKKDFNNNTLKVTLRSSEPGYSNVTIGKSAYQVEFIEGVKPVTKFKIEHDGYFQKNQAETIKVIAVDEEGNKSPSVNFPGFANIITTEGSATLDTVQLQARDFKAGVATFTLKTSDEKNIKIRVQNGGLVGESSYLRLENENVFADVNRNHKNYTAIKYLKDNNILDGYSDGTFKPNGVVNRVEALKMLMLAFDIKVDEGLKAVSFKDTESNAWYIPTLSTAVNKGIVKGYEDGTFKPANIVNKAEYLKILFETTGIKTDVEIIQPYADVGTNLWFAKYAFMANKMNLLDPATRLYPDRGMTRAEVAETIYRMRVIEDENLLTYSK